MNHEYSEEIPLVEYTTDGILRECLDTIYIDNTLYIINKNIEVEVEVEVEVEEETEVEVEVEAETEVEDNNISDDSISSDDVDKQITISSDTSIPSCEIELVEISVSNDTDNAPELDEIFDRISHRERDCCIIS